MNKKIIILFVIAVVVIAYFANFLPGLSIYGTGLNLDTDTQNFPRFRGVTGIKTNEFIDEELFVTSWYSGGRSIKIVCSGSAKYEKGYAGTGEIGKYWYVVEMKDQNNNWYEIISKGDYEPDIVHFTQGDCYEKKFPGVQYGYPSDDWANPSGDTTLSGESISFYVKGSHIGGIRVKMMMRFRYWEGWGHVVKTKEILHDEAYFVSGKGSIEVLPDGKIDDQLVSGQLQYVFEEGSIVTFSVDTDYSGITQGEQYSDEGWQLRLFNPDGNLVETWPIGDNKRDYRVYYTIPTGAYNPGRNDWEVFLRNILVKQDEKDIFVIDTYEKMPGATTVTLDKSQYEIGETVTVTATAKANPSGTNSIYEFYCLAYYGNQRIDYALNPTYKKATSIGDDKYQTVFSLIAYKGDKWLTVECTAYDGPHDQGGRAGTTGYVQAYIKDEDPIPPVPPPRPPESDNLLSIIVALVVFAIFCVIGLLAPFPKKYGMIGTIGFVVAGIVLAVLIYLGIIPIG